jgi:hypothetical protein
MLDDEAINSLLAYHVTSGVIGDSPEVLRPIVGAPGNAVEISPEGLTILVYYRENQRVIRKLLSKVGKTHYIYWVCSDCGYQSERRKELRDQFEDRDITKLVKYNCQWCASLAIKNPNVARCLVEFGENGRSPFAISNETHCYGSFYCRNVLNPIEPCKSAPMIRLVRRVSKKGPICDNCRALIRSENLKPGDLDSEELGAEVNFDEGGRSWGGAILAETTDPGDFGEV